MAGKEPRKPVLFGKKVVLPLERRKLALRYRARVRSTMSEINRAVEAVMEVARDSGCATEDEAELEIAVREALANAIIHGNEKDPQKTVLLRCYCDPERGMLLAIRDEGSGFDPEEVPDPRDAERVHLSHGRGIFLMREFMDHVEHRKGGREVLLLKKKVGAKKSCARPERS